MRETNGSSTYDNTDADSYANSMTAATGRTYLWSAYKYDDSMSSDITNSYRRLKVMALAYTIPGSTSYLNASLKTKIKDGMNWIYANWYNANVPPPTAEAGSNIKNWWDYQIGTPLEILDICTLMYADFTSNERSNYMVAIERFTPDYKTRFLSNPDGEVTGANRVWFSTVIALRGIIVKDSLKMVMAKEGLTDVFDYVTTSDGFYTDGSFIQHQYYPYTGGYGVSLLTTLAEELYLLSGSTFYPTVSTRINVRDWVYNAYAPIIYKGCLMSNTMGREISRSECQEILKGRLAAEAVSILAAIAETADKPKMKGLVKSWVQAQGSAATSPARYQVFIDSIMQDASVTPNTDYNYACRQFANMDRVVQRTPGYAFSVSMFSNRTRNYEQRTNGTTSLENNKAWHTADGMTYLYNADSAQFNENYWPTVNAYRLPGTTVVDNTQIDGYKANNKKWVGGAVVLGRYGATGMDFDPVSQLQSCRKSWFMLNGKIVCLGSNVVTSGMGSVHTYIENRKLKSNNTNTFVVNNVTQSNSMTAITTFANASWAHLTGNVAGADIGYCFPTPVNLNMLRKSYTGSWQDLNYKQNAASYTHNYLIFWKDHGANATNTEADANKYAYILLPGYTKTATQNYAASPDVVILKNNSITHAVKDNSANILAANFFSASGDTVTVGGVASYLKSNKSASVIMKQSNDTLFMSIAEPTMEMNDSINITLKEQMASVISKDARIRVVSLNTLSIKAGVDASVKGRSLEIKFKMAAGATLNREASQPITLGAFKKDAALNNDGLKLSVFPNPAVNTTNIQIQTGNNIAPVVIDVVDMNGVLVNSFKKQPAKGRINQVVPLKRLATGMYMIIAWQGNIRKSMPLIVQ